MPMFEMVEEFLKSKNPFIVAVGLFVVTCAFLFIAFTVTSRVNAFEEKYETREAHKDDVEQRVGEFRKDVRIAILENNKVLLDEMEKRFRK